ncbi:hypothetical protein ACFO1B_02860 [Dactylosporangium siamense]|uniref:Uncharacterized protein n=1 Tax=Dactylosporangium siamense TaxID=685454 RepID=A0A919PXP9_9ACTN|nr:hypothetical protein [Dactylosporangium siamense]GIG52695.1 hypothetical protein Dsi01nite_107360 [Dactylosporangium siamense]
MSPFTLAALDRSPGELAAELAADLWATSTGAADAAARWLSRPALLRRLAEGLAGHVPATADRIAAGGPGAAALGAAVSLWTGLPFVAFPEGSDVPDRDWCTPELGELDRGDRVVVVALNGATARDLVPRLRADGAVIAAVAVVVAEEPGVAGVAVVAEEPGAMALVRRGPHGFVPA